MGSESIPLVSVIMPAYNCSQYVKPAIESILKQTYTNFELLIADDCSTDDTRQVIDSFTDERIRRFHNSSNKGYLQASNLLFKESKGAFITFQDADDWSSENRLEMLVDELKKDNNLFCVGSFVKRADDEGNILSELTFKEDPESIKNDLPYTFNCIGSALMIRRAALEKVGPYNPYFDRIGSEDLYWFGLIAADYKVKNLPVALYYYRNTPNSVSNMQAASIRKSSSKEMASKGVQFYMKRRKEIFNNKYRLSVIERFIHGKYECWKGEFKKGIGHLFLSVLMNPFCYPERYFLLKTYLPKALLNSGPKETAV